MTTFQLHRVLGRRPAEINDGDVVFNAPRPLYGSALSCDLIGFTSIVHKATYRRGDLIDGNLRMDARVIEWIDPVDAIEIERARLVAAYGADAIEQIDDSDLLDSWRIHGRLGTIEIDTRDLAESRLAERHYEIENGGV